MGTTVLIILFFPFSKEKKYRMIHYSSSIFKGEERKQAVLWQSCAPLELFARRRLDLAGGRTKKPALAEHAQLTRRVVV